VLFPQTAPDEPTPVSVPNDFLPADRPYTECISAVQPLGCGSEARGGWEQGVLFGVLVAGLVIIGWRIVRSTRRRQQPAPTSGVSTPGPDAGS